MMTAANKNVSLLEALRQMGADRMRIFSEMAPGS